MFRKFASAAVIAVSALSFTAVAQAEDFPATPMNHGPMMMSGAQPMAAPGPAMSERGMERPMMRKRMSRHHMTRRHMMHKKMMRRKSM